MKNPSIVRRAFNGSVKITVYGMAAMAFCSAVHMAVYPPAGLYLSVRHDWRQSQPLPEKNSIKLDMSKFLNLDIG